MHTKVDLQVAIRQHLQVFQENLLTSKACLEFQRPGSFGKLTKQLGMFQTIVCFVKEDLMRGITWVIMW